MVRGKKKRRKVALIKSKDKPKKRPTWKGLPSKIILSRNTIFQLTSNLWTAAWLPNDAVGVAGLQTAWYNGRQSHLQPWSKGAFPWTHTCWWAPNQKLSRACLLCNISDYQQLQQIENSSRYQIPKVPRNDCRRKQD